VSGPFTFIANNRLKPGKLAEERRARARPLVEFVEANEPQLIASPSRDETGWPGVRQCCPRNRLLGVVPARAEIG